MEKPPFNFPNPLGYFGGTKQIRAEAAYLYDAVHLYAKALIKVLEMGENPRNGSAIINAVKGVKYMSAMGWVSLFYGKQIFFYSILYSYLVYIDENGDAAGNYTILAREKLRENGREDDYGLYPVGTFSAPDQEQIPV